MAHPIPVPHATQSRPYMQYGFRPLSEDLIMPTPGDFPFWRYVGVSVMAGLITNFAIRALTPARKKS